MGRLKLIPAVRLAIGVSVAATACQTVPRAERLSRLEQGVTREAQRQQGTEELIARLELTSSAPQQPTTAGVAYYEPTPIRFEPVRAGSESGIRDLTVRSLEQSAAAAFTYLGEKGERSFAPPWNRQRFEGVPPAVMYAVSAAAKPEFSGSERDLLVPAKASPITRVTVWNGLDQHIRAHAAPDLPSVASAPVDEGALRTRFGIGALEGWSSRELASLDEALGLLEPGELALIAGLPFKRAGSSSDVMPGGGKERNCGYFRLEAHERWIAIFDCAFDMDEFGFVGDPASPHKPSVRVVLHEIGHAISMARLSELYARLSPTWRELPPLIDEYNRLGKRLDAEEAARFAALHDEIQQLNVVLAAAQEALAPTRAGPFDTAVLRAFLALPGARSGFTPYGRTSGAESFAEAFSLFRADPEACRRISPEVFAFFASGGHVR